MLSLAAYADRLSVRPGETISFKVANATGHPVSANIVRVISSDANPAGLGIRVQEIEARVSKLAEPGPFQVPSGSYAIVDDLEAWPSGDSFTLCCRVFPTLLNGRRQGLITRSNDTRNRGFGLMISEDGCVLGTMGNGSAFEGAQTREPLKERRWQVVWLRFDAGSREFHIGHAPFGSPATTVANCALSTEASPMADGPLLMAAANHDAPNAHFNGKLERPTLYDRALSDEEIQSAIHGEEPPGASVCWDFAQAVSTSRIVDVESKAVHGRLVNTPARAMTGAGWSGYEMCFRHAPDEYGAIHFHEDDIDDCEWPTAFQWTVPDDTRSSVYALMLSAGDSEENVPFHVVPPKGRATARIAVLASTFTYTIYANHARPEWDRDPEWQASWRKQSSDWGGYPHNPGEHLDYGLSTYNYHSDGSGISIASWRRPMLNVRLGYLTYPYEEIRASGLRHFPADSHLNAWLEDKKYDYDIITDWELHQEGVDLLKQYSVVLTGSHPEYHTREMIDALEAYRDGGGRFCYLGGNGFYWKIALSPEKDGVIEIRRGEGGIRAWAAEPGEYYNQFDGEYGGLWRRNGRPPQHLCGIGFTAQGNFLGSYYRKHSEAVDPRVAWMFDGVDEEIFGNHGLSGHGAAGFELDRADKRLGTPEHAMVVASSENHPADAPWVLVPEEMLTHIVTWSGEPAKDLIRADMTFFECPNGGAVFSTGSITFCGSLVTNNFDNDVSRLLGNVLTRFLNPEPFQMPS
ncbi:MAG: N,N-dimethylformamidase large subunit [Gammaproteobacteria bacterium]|jgi:N,N-dimethylformamidase|nr:N,N-dimethylformamidase large subunit [Gammaproteobacteria bacterium]